MNNDEELNYTDFIKLLKVYSISYPKDKILKIFKFINVPNPNKITLNLIFSKFNECKIISS